MTVAGANSRTREIDGAMMMTKRLFCLLGLVLAGLGSVQAQEVAAPPSDLLAFAPTEDNAWVTGEFLFGWSSAVKFSPLVTTSPGGTVQADAGVLGKTNTTTLLSGPQNSGLLPGFRFGAGYIYDQEDGLGVEAGFTFLSSNSSSFAFDSADHNGILARPYTDATNSSQASVLVGFPGLSTGTINIDSKVDSFYSVNLDMTENIVKLDSGLQMETLFGYRFASFGDSLKIRHHLVSTTMPGTSIDVNDSFSAKNTFNGLDLGLRTSYSLSDRLSLSVLTKVAAGNMQRTVDIRGRTVTTVAGGAGSPVTANGGMLALSSNIGEHRSNEWTVLPEGGVNLAWKLRSNMNLRLGYSLVYLTKAARANDQIDTTVNPNLFPPAVSGATPLRPSFPGNFNDFWIQSLNLGLDVTF